MSGYGGQPPAWNDPYGQEGPGQAGQAGQDPYGQGQGWNDPNVQGGWNDPNAQQQNWDPYGQHDQPPGYGYGPPGVPSTGGSAPGSTIAALICNCVATAMCCNVFAIAGIVTSAMAMNRSRTDPASARSLTMWSWVILGAAMAVQIVLVVIAIVVDANSPDYSSSGF